MKLVLADAQPVVLISVYKPVLMVLVAAGWGWMVTRLDKDLQTLFLPRQTWNLVQLLGATLGFLLWLMIPYFWLGLVVALMLTAGPISGYILFRNTKVESEHRWRLSADMFTRTMAGVQAAQAQRAASVALLNADGSRKPVPSGQEPAVAAHQKLEDLLDFALPRKGDRIDVVVGANQQVAAVVQVDGVKFPQEGLDARAAVALIDYVKQSAALDVEDRRKRQQGPLGFDAGELGKHLFMVTTAGSTRELSLTLRIDPDLRASVGLGKLGLLEPQRQQINKVVRERRGVVLISAPSGQGLTTTLYSLLHEHDPYMHSVVTLEDEVAFEMEGVNHHVLEPGVEGQAIAQRLSALIRQDPQAIMVSRLADAQIARLSARHAHEMRFYLGLRQDDTFGALKLFVKAVGDAAAAAKAVDAVLAQRLVRRLCTTCRAPYKPDPEALRKLNLPTDKVDQLYKHSGQVLIKNKPQPCPKCQGLAYRGRIGVFEVMVLDGPARELVAAGQFDQLRTHLRKNRMLWLQEAALARAVDGTTSIGEITRVLGGK